MFKKMKDQLQRMDRSLALFAQTQMDRELRALEKQEKNDRIVTDHTDWLENLQCQTNHMREELWDARAAIAYLVLAVFLLFAAVWAIRAILRKGHHKKVVDKWLA